MTLLPRRLVSRIEDLVNDRQNTVQSLASRKAESADNPVDRHIPESSSACPSKCHTRGKAPLLNLPVNTLALNPSFTGGKPRH